MHASSFRLMQKYVSAHVVAGADVLDVGSRIAAGQTDTYKTLLDHCNYHGLDMQAGGNVDIVMDDPYVFPIEDNTYDHVISGQAFEHIEYPWLTICEIARVMKPGGKACIIAPSSGPEHRHPFDCYRYYPDGFRALATWAKLNVVSCQWHTAAPWHDCILIAEKPHD